MLDGGADPLYVGRRMVRMAIEDVGLADPRALRVAPRRLRDLRALGDPEGELALAEAAIYLACAAKSKRCTRRTIARGLRVGRRVAAGSGSSAQCTHQAYERPRLRDATTAMLTTTDAYAVVRIFFRKACPT